MKEQEILFSVFHVREKNEEVEELMVTIPAYFDVQYIANIEKEERNDGNQKFRFESAIVVYIWHRVLEKI